MPVYGQIPAKRHLFDTCLEVIEDRMANKYPVLDEVCDLFLNLSKGFRWFLYSAVVKRNLIRGNSEPLTMSDGLIPLNSVL